MPKSRTPPAPRESDADLEDPGWLAGSTDCERTGQMFKEDLAEWCRQFGAWLKDTRESVGLGVTELSRRAGVGLDTITRLEAQTLVNLSLHSAGLLGKGLGLKPAMMERSLSRVGLPFMKPAREYPDEELFSAPAYEESYRTQVEISDDAHRVRTAMRHDLGTYLSRKRQEAGLSIDQLSRRSGVGERTIALLEAGRLERPNFFVVMAASHSFGAPLREVFATIHASSLKHAPPTVKARAESPTQAHLRPAFTQPRALATLGSGAFAGNLEVIRAHELLGIEVAKARDDLGLSQRALGLRSNTSAQIIQNLEEGQQRVGFMNYFSIMAALGKSPEQACEFLSEVGFPHLDIGRVSGASQIPKQGLLAPTQTRSAANVDPARRYAILRQVMGQWGDELAQRRRELGHTLQSLSQISGLSYMAISNMEQGKTYRVPLAHACAVSMAVGLHPAHLALHLNDLSAKAMAGMDSRRSFAPAAPSDLMH